MKVLTRMVLYGNNVLMYQRRRYFLCIPFLYWWSDWYPLNNELHQKDLTIEKHVDKLKRLLQDRDDIESHLKEKIKELGGRHVSETFNVKTNEFWFRKHANLSPVDGKWRSMLNSKLFKPGTSGVAHTVRERANLPDHPNSHRGKSAYVAKDYAQFSGHINVDSDVEHVIEFKEPSQNRSKNNSRKRRQGESPEDHEARLREMDSN